MSEEAGISASAVAAAQNALAQRGQGILAADTALAAAVAGAHAATVGALQKLDTISTEIESAVAQQHLLALDTPAGTRDFQRFLLAKHHAIIGVVNDAVALADAKAVEVRGLTDHYRAAPERGAQ